jgi:hypothetical protein
MNLFKVPTCKICNKNYSSKASLWNHNKKFHGKDISKNTPIISTDSPNVSIKNSLLCKYCAKKFSSTQNKWKHENKVCKKKEEINKIELLQAQVNELTSKIANITNNTTNNHLIDIIVDKSKAIENLQSKIENTINNNLTEVPKITPTLNLNNVLIVSRSEDNYINATQLCQAGGKRFNNWYQLETTKQLINALKSKTGIPVLELIEINKGGSHLGSWIHPDLAIQLAQWISPIFALQVSSWIRTLFTNGNVSIDVKLLEDKNKEIKLKDHKIQLLQDAFVKKQTRTNYRKKNVIYMLTTEDNKKKRNYIIGKTTNLTKRLSNYNKSNEHEVIYYKECNNEEDMTIIESIILNKLKKYQEKANRDRFILPIENDISLFINIIDKCIHNFYL